MNGIQTGAQTQPWNKSGRKTSAARRSFKRHWELYLLLVLPLLYIFIFKYIPMVGV